MESKRITLSPQRAPDTGFDLAYRLAREKLAETPDLEQLARRSDTQYEKSDSRRRLVVKYLNQLYSVTLPDAGITLMNAEGETPIRDKILILHYLTRARGTPLSGKTINYKELPDGTTYFPTFYKRAIKPIVDNFGRAPQQLPDTARALGGQKASFGDVAVTISAFSRVPVTFVLWRGDDEFPPEGNIMFDSTVPDYLSIEDVNVLCETIAWRLVKLKTKTT